ncbi:MAG: hypothetical protein J6C93_01335 [Clostridia bacterium]|nr:hypothetical protein [Clostridia bacterium]
MRFKNAFSVLIDNYGNVFKLLLYRLITGVVFFSLAYVIVSLNLRGIVNSAETGEVIALIKEFLSALTSGQTDYLQGFNETFMSAVKNFLIMLQGRIGTIVWSVVGLVFIYILSRFFNGLGVFTVGSAIDDRMQTYAHTKFSSSFFMDFGRAALYQVVYVPLVFVYDVLSILACWFFFFYALSFLPLLMSIILVVTSLVCLQAVKLSFVSAWMPAIVTDKQRVFPAMKKSFRALRGFSKRFASYLVTIYLVIIVNVIATICTLGSGLLLSVPTSYVFLLCLQYVHYNEDEGKKYFLSYHKIADSHDKPSVLGE